MHPFFLYTDIPLLLRSLFPSKVETQVFETGGWPRRYTIEMKMAIAAMEVHDLDLLSKKNLPFSFKKLWADSLQPLATLGSLLAFKPRLHDFQEALNDAWAWKMY